MSTHVNMETRGKPWELCLRTLSPSGFYFVYVCVCVSVSSLAECSLSLQRWLTSEPQGCNYLHFPGIVIKSTHRLGEQTWILLFRWQGLSDCMVFSAPSFSLIASLSFVFSIYASEVAAWQRFLNIWYSHWTEVSFSPFCHDSTYMYQNRSQTHCRVKGCERCFQKGRISLHTLEDSVFISNLNLVLFGPLACVATFTVSETSGFLS